MKVKNRANYGGEHNVLGRVVVLKTGGQKYNLKISPKSYKTEIRILTYPGLVSSAAVTAAEETNPWLA